MLGRSGAVLTPMFQNALTDAFLVFAGYFITAHGDLLTVMDTPCESI
jgi:hypothetical protein